jgi:hypothetical protein
MLAVCSWVLMAVTPKPAPTTEMAIFCMLAFIGCTPFALMASLAWRDRRRERPYLMRRYGRR